MLQIAVVGAEEGAIDSISGNEGRLAQAWVNVGGGLAGFSVCFWHSEGWTPRHEALLEAVVRQAEVTRHPWLVACDANMCPEDFENRLWFQSRHMCMEAQKACVDMQIKKAQKVSGSKGSMIMSLRCHSQKKIFTDGGGRRL